MFKKLLPLFSSLLLAGTIFAQNNAIRINQLGYLPQSIKVAVFISGEETEVHLFQLKEAITNKIVFEGKPQKQDGSEWGIKSAYRLNFSNYQKEGAYFLQFANSTSPFFKINNDVYEGTADFLLNYMRQQRCGYNPFLKDSCHKHDGIIVDHPTKSGEKAAVTGGWHDASDYLQYVTTSANATYQMLFACTQNPEIFNDNFKANGHEGSNGIPDILDEAKWGLDWLVKMNPSKNEMYNQIADDRDHCGYRLPNQDSARYDLEGFHRPVYFITGKPQGLAKHKNRSTGVSSSAAKFASAFALGAQTLSKYYPAFSKKIAKKAGEAYEFALSDLGVCQTACNVSPYFYEEENYVDDLELAACALFQLTHDEYYLKEAQKWGIVENVTPWMSTGFARHYQFYPFVNLGHIYLSEKKTRFANYLKLGLQAIYTRGKKDAFFNGIPFIWCSNNLVVAAITQARKYEQNTGDSTFSEMEAALRDWLFGCNPWGTSMICGLPAGGDNPQLPHSSFTKIRGETTTGGLVDGPVYNSIFSSLIGIKISLPDKYATFNKGKAVYHDDIADYSSNEPTMDGTASLTFYLSAMEKLGRSQTQSYHKDEQGAIRKINPSKKNIFLAFTAHDNAEGGNHILKVLKKNKIKASFFFTGAFLRNTNYRAFVKSVLTNGHYVGPHSNQHLLYCDWKNQNSLLVDKNTFETDIQKNYDELKQFDISKNDASWFMPPYEWYNRSIVDWSESLGLKVVNFTPGVRSNADYTTPDMKNYRSSEEIMKSIFQFESKNNLNGAVILIHPGTHKTRTDKFYFHLQELIDKLEEKGYDFKRL